MVVTKCFNTGSNSTRLTMLHYPCVTFLSIKVIPLKGTKLFLQKREMILALEQFDHKQSFLPVSFAMLHVA